MVFKPQGWSFKGAISAVSAPSYSSATPMSGGSIMRPQGSLSKGVIRITPEATYHPTAKNLAMPSDTIWEPAPPSYMQYMSNPDYTISSDSSGKKRISKKPVRDWIEKHGENYDYTSYSPHEIIVYPDDTFMEYRYGVGTSNVGDLNTQRYVYPSHVTQYDKYGRIVKSQDYKNVLRERIGRTELASEKTYDRGELTGLEEYKFSTKPTYSTVKLINKKGEVEREVQVENEFPSTSRMLSAKISAPLPGGYPELYGVRMVQANRNPVQKVMQVSRPKSSGQSGISQVLSVQRPKKTGGMLSPSNILSKIY